MTIVRLTALLDMPRLTSAKPRLRHDRRHAHPSLLNLTLNLCILSFVLWLALHPLNFFNCFSPRESVSVFAYYLRSHFSVSQPKVVCNRARSYLSKLCSATCPEESHSSFCFPFSPTEFLVAASNLSSFTAIFPDKAAYPVLKHLSCFSMDFFLHIFKLSWSLYSFPLIWKTSYIIPIYKMGKPLDSPASFCPISLIFCDSKTFCTHHSIISTLLSGV